MSTVKASLVKGFSKSVVFVMAEMYVVWSGLQNVKARKSRVIEIVRVADSAAPQM